jgi:hypothetical protein
MPDADDKPPPDFEFLRSAFASEQECLSANLRSSQRIKHAGDRGEVNEQFFIDFLRTHLPNRYTVEKAMVLDCNGAVSHSIDVVIFDRQYTPTLLDSHKHRYVPAEAVYAVFECKPMISKETLAYAGKKIASVRGLARTTIPIPHAGGTHDAKELFEIIGGILAIDVSWGDGLGASFKAAEAGMTGVTRVDCGLAVSGSCFDTFREDQLQTFGPSRNALAIFAFRLLSKLQSLGTVPAIDWMAYARRLAESEEAG